MDLRRSGECAFGIGVLMCGGAFLLLAVERFNAPVVTGVGSSPAIVAVASPARAVAASTAPVAVVRRPIVPRISVVRRLPVSSQPRPIAALPAPERPRVVAQPTKRAAAHAPERRQAPIAAARRPDAKRSPRPRVLALANTGHRTKDARDRSPVAERTPEPPIGYDDHPALLRSDGPSATMPTMEPVHVELTTTHLGH